MFDIFRSKHSEEAKPVSLSIPPFSHHGSPLLTSNYQGVGSLCNAAQCFKSVFLSVIDYSLTAKFAWDVAGQRSLLQSETGQNVPS